MGKELEPRRILITGGTGLVGGPLVERLLERGWEVQLIARNPPKLQHPGLSWKKTDLESVDSLKGITAGFDTVLHLTNLARASVSRDFKVAEMLVEDVLEQKVPNFLYASSIRVYGARSGTIDESAVPAPLPDDEYGINKVRIEQMIRDRLGATGTNFRLLRIGQVISDAAVPSFLRMLSIRFLLMWGRAYHHFIHVNDVVDAIAFLVDSGSLLKFDTYNITREMEGNITFKSLRRAGFPLWKRLVCDCLSLPIAVPFRLYRERPQARGTHAAAILNSNLHGESWKYRGASLENSFLAGTKIKK